jgi:hypothetical protein
MHRKILELDEISAIFSSLSELHCMVLISYNKHVFVYMQCFTKNTPIEIVNMIISKFDGISIA